MGRPTPETRGGTPQNQGLSEFKPLAKERGVGWGVKKPEEPKQQPADPRWESYDRFFRKGPMRPAVLEGLPSSRPSRQSKDEVSEKRPLSQKPGEQNGEAEPREPNSTEQQSNSSETTPKPRLRRRPRSIY
jgi:hypothetical protein